MLTIDPATPSRRMTSAAAWIMNSGARTLTADHRIEALGLGRPHVVAPRRRGDVDHAVHDTELLICGSDHTARRVRICHVGLDEHRRRAEVGQLICQRLPSVDASSGDHQSCGAVGDHLTSDRLAETLCAAADDDHLAGQLSCAVVMFRSSAVEDH